MLVVHGHWPRVEARLSIEESGWSGPVSGSGQLEERRARVVVHRGARPPQRADLAWPGLLRVDLRRARDPQGVGVRVMVVWCPDWSVVAALDEAEGSPRSPAAVLSANVVEVCNGPARAEGVRRGQRRRDAQARCPELVLLPANPDRDARAFEPVLAIIEDLRPGVAALRPGLLAVRAPGSLYGGETEAAATTGQALVEVGVWDVRIGVADDLFTAEQAARRADVQDVGGRARRRLRVVPARPARARAPGRRAEGRELVGLLQRLGLRTLGDLADLPADAVEHRLGTLRRRGPAPGPRRGPRALRGPHPAARARRRGGLRAAARLRRGDQLQRAHHRRAVRLPAGAPPAGRHRGAGRGRVGRHRLLVPHLAAPAAGSLPATWSTGCTGSCSRPRSAARCVVAGPGAVRAPVDRVRFVPEVVEPGSRPRRGAVGRATDDRVERGVARVQGMVGFDAVRRPVLQGGRGPAAGRSLVPWGERAADLRPVDRPWPGRVPGPAPARVFAEPPAAEVVDDTGREVCVTDRGVVSGEPRRSG